MRPSRSRSTRAANTAGALELLAQTYDALGLTGGRLLSVGETASEASVADADWARDGEWLELANRMGADRIFFVDEDPVLVFIALPEGSGEELARDRYRQAWSLARPQCVFLATEDEIRAYPLTTLPRRSAAGWSQVDAIGIADRSGDIAAQLDGFSRALVESGEAFLDNQFEVHDHRADRQLLQDVRRASSQLVDDGMRASVAHALIERVLLVRYLEDRGVIDGKYYLQLVGHRQEWAKVLLERSPEIVGARREPGLENVLRDRDFTLAAFRQLAADFNGDLFVIEDEEAALITQESLTRVRSMLLGDTEPGQQPFFLWAYDFNVVPTGLISSMYEQFFHADRPGDDSGTHYTPPELVSLTTNQVLTPDVLAGNPRILDPACGSGIFLVEAFRAIVRHEMLRLQRRLSGPELRMLLLDRVAGIDFNNEAIRLAAFSLYLALLDYQRPQDILQAGPLPKLIAGPENPRASAVLVCDDTFAFAEGESPSADRDREKFPWPLGSFDVVIGNPPWDERKGKVLVQEDVWVHSMGVKVGDRSPSQAFLWRSHTLLKEGGIGGLLVASSITANVRSRDFRDSFFAQVQVRRVVNFNEARNLFFTKGSAPFLLLVFQKQLAGDRDRFPYLTMRRSAALSSTGAVAFGRLDRQLVRQSDVGQRHYLWKTYSWGSHHDAELLALLETEERLGAYLARHGTDAGLGWQTGDKRVPDFIAHIPELNVRTMHEWGPVLPAELDDPPRSVGRPTRPEYYSGQRLIVSRRAYAGRGPRIRLEAEHAYSFKHRAYGVPLQHCTPTEAKVILATMTSSLGRYSMFMRSGRWTAWYDEVTKEDLLATPIRLPDERDPITERLVVLIDALADLDRAIHPLSPDPENKGREQEFLEALDETVFDMFELTPAQRDLILDLIAHIRQLSADGKDRTERVERPPVMLGTARDLDRLPTGRKTVVPYLDVFLRSWNRELGPRAELSWELHHDTGTRVMCVVFTTKDTGDPLTIDVTPTGDWSNVLASLERVTSRPVGHELYAEGLLRATTDRQIVIARRDEPRLWTASKARDDAEATMLRVSRIAESA